MASVTNPPPVADADPHLADPHLVDEQIHRTRRALKLLDLVTGTLTLVIGVLLFLLAAAVVEHWLVPGGWGATGRAALFALLAAGVLWYGWRRFWPLISQSINPVYAARTIEQSSPSLKNSLLNLLLLRRQERQLSPQVVQAIERQATQRLSQISLEGIIDRTNVIRLGYVFLAVLAIFALYHVLSPKDPFASAGRVLMPWADIPVPSRVEIHNVKPGDASLARGEQLEISAELVGLADDDAARIHYTTADRQVVDKALPLVSESGILHTATLPGRGAGGIEQPIEYWIEAGDALSRRYRVEVFSRPTLIVEQVHYDFPAYTGYPSRVVENTGDLSGIEGTLVTLTAVANKPIRQAHVDFEADGRNDVLMKVDGRRAVVTFPLELRDDRRTPRYQSYVLRYVTDEGHFNENPPKYQIDVTPDYAPEVQLLLPAEASVNVHVDEAVEFQIEARDPDFALRSVELLGTVEGKQVLKESLLEKMHTGRFDGKLRRTPRELELKVGDVLDYWARAADSRRPDANATETPHRQIHVVGPPQLDRNQQPPQNGENQQGEGDGQSNDGAAGDNGVEGGASAPDDSGQPGEEQGQGGGQSDGQSPSADQQPGEGQGGNSKSGDATEGQQNEKQPGGEQGEPGESGEQQPQEGQADAEPGEGSEPGGAEQPVSSAGDDDGRAFERIADHFHEQEGESAGDQNEGQQSEGNQNDPKQPDAGQSEGANDGKQAEDDSSAETGAKPQEAPGAEGDQREQQTPGEAAEGEPQPGDEASPQQGKEGEQPAGQSDPSAMNQDQGGAGAGENRGDETGAPGSDPKQPTEKQPDDESGGAPNDQEAPAESDSQKESDSRGDQGGDQSGGGQEGGGQQADDQGAGAAGEHQPADQGGGQSTEPGEGETGSQPGQDQTAPGKTGESSGDQPGQGTEQSDQPGQSGEQPSAEGDSGEKPNEGNPSGNPAGGKPDGGVGQGGSGSTNDEETMPGDQANLDYARRQTDLILEKLEDQLDKNAVDKDLLKELGWSQDDLRRFVDRWKNLKEQAARNDSPEAEGELDEALRSLGLAPQRRTQFRSATMKDRLRDLQEAYRGRTPLEFQDQLRAYVQGTAAGEEESAPEE